MHAFRVKFHQLLLKLNLDCILEGKLKALLAIQTLVLLIPRDSHRASVCSKPSLLQSFENIRAVVLNLFAPGAHFGTFSKFAVHLDKNADCDYCQNKVCKAI